MQRPLLAALLVIGVPLTTQVGAIFAAGVEGLAATAAQAIKLDRPPTIPDPPTPAQAQPAQKPVTAGATACPAGAGLIGPKLDLPPGGNTFEEAPLLIPCTYKGLEDPKGWTYFKVSLVSGQTLKVTARTRDSNVWPRSLWVRLHGSNGGQVGENSTQGASAILEIGYTVKEPGFAYLAVADVVRDVAFQISIQ
jgi:hypothetical protein